MKALLVQCDDALDYTPGADVTAGDVIQLDDGRAAIVQSTLKSGALGAALDEGVFSVVSGTAVVFAAGETVVWDVSAGTAINPESADLADFVIGTAIKAKISGDLSVRVDLNSLPTRRKIMVIAAAKTLTAADLGATVYVDTHTAGVAVTLPTAATCKGGRFAFIRAGTGVNAITLTAAGSEKVDGGATFASCAAARDTVTIESDGSNWYVVAARIA